MPRRRNREQVYIISCLTVVKIGRSRNPVLRRSTLQTSNPFDLKLEMVLDCKDAVALESWLHNWFKMWHIRLEWFNRPAEAVTAAIRTMIAEGKIKAVEAKPNQPVKKAKRPAPAREIPVGTVLHEVTCLWCGNTDLVENPRQQYCNNRNHRIYRSKKRSATLFSFWMVFNEVFHPEVAREDAMAKFDPAEAEKTAAHYGFSYSDETRRWGLYDFSAYAGAGAGRQ